MKQALLFLSCSSALLLSPSAELAAQNYLPFNASNRKLFTSDPDQHWAYSLALDSVVTNGDITSHYNFRTAWDTLTPSNCGWWGGDACYRHDRPTWLGGRIDKDAAGVHTFFNLWNEAITIPFHTNALDTVVMYADGAQQFLLSYDGEGPGDILGLVDNMRQWTIHHRDLTNNPIPSAINGAAVRVGETLGMTYFFRIDSFPQVLQPVSVAGFESQGVGLYQITPAMLADHQPGDEIQWNEWRYQYNGPPWNNYDRYRKRIFLERTDTPDSVIYVAREEVFNAGELTLNVDTLELKYARNTIIATLPFERFDGTRPWLHRDLYCEIPMWTYDTYLNAGLAYCMEEDCWGPFDTNGPPAQGGMTQVIGLGTYRSHSAIWSPSGYQADDRIIYFKKNGITCMNEAIMGLPNTTMVQPAVQLGPNPTDGLVNFTSAVPIVEVELMDMHGRIMQRTALFNASGNVDLSVHAEGLYVIRFRFANGSISTHRVIRQ
jgi:hypothetical protein